MKKEVEDIYISYKILIKDNLLQVALCHQLMRLRVFVIQLNQF